MHKLNLANPASRSRIRTLLRKQECKLLSALAPPRSDPHPFQASTQFCHPFLLCKPSIRCMQAKVSRLSTAFADVVPAPCRCSLAAPPSRSRCWDCQARRRTCKPPCRRSSKRCPPVSPRHRRVVRKASPLSPKAAGWAGRLAAGQGSWGVVWRWSRQPAGRSLEQACYGRCWQGRSSGRSPAVPALTPLATWIVSAHWP